jgi:hypothetical protein
MFNKKILSIGAVSVLGSLLLAKPAAAVCPVCTVAVAAGVGLSRWLGIDDTISGLWIGAIYIILAMWTIVWLEKKNFQWLWRNFLVYLLWLALLVYPLVWTDIVGHPQNTLWGVDKLLLGIVIGAIIFYVTDSSYDYLKKKNNNRPFFPLQKVVVPTAALLLASVIFYLFTK